MSEHTMLPVTVRSDPDYPMPSRRREQLALIISSRKRTLPGSRSYGLTGDAVDRHAPSAVSEFAIDLQEACDEWIPDIAVVAAQKTADQLGNLGLDVEVESR